MSCWLHPIAAASVVTGLLKVWDPRKGRYAYFGLDHYSTCWLGQAREGAAHNAVHDAAKSVKVFNAYTAVMYVLSCDVYSPPLICLLRTTTATMTHTTNTTLINSRWMHARHDPAAVAAVGQRILTTPPEPSFSKLNPTFEGVCQGNKNTCRCGAPKFF